MNVMVMSRYDAIEYCKKEHNIPTIMISISDPYIQYFDGGTFCSNQNNILAIQDIYISDADKPGKDVYGRNVSENNLINDSHAFVIKRLLNKYPNVDIPASQ